MLPRSTLGICLAAALAAGCAKEKTCEPGTEGCGCLAGDLPCRGDNVVCSKEAICKRLTCTAGNEGCACLTSGSCNPVGDGVLACDSARCIRVGCTAGTTGCTCNGDGSCESGAICSSERCIRESCRPGELNCSCNGETCNSGLLCQNHTICTTATGYAGGLCNTDGTCHQGNRCQGGVCVPCDIGSKSCSCYSSSTCSAGLACVASLCVQEPSAALKIPASPRCFTPCASDLTRPDGTVRSCSAEGLMDGCIDGNTCVDGSCVKPGGSPPTCASDIDCPDFQACMSGRCYSSCDYDSDCVSGLRCSKHVCRITCQTGANASCPDGEHCVTGDGQTGVCVPIKRTSSGQQKVSPGAFALDHESISFSNIHVGDALTLTNNSGVYQEFTLRKMRHTEYHDDGPLTVTDNPLSWLKIGDSAGTSMVQQVTIGVEPNGGTSKVAFDGANNDALPKWDGLLELSNPSMGTRTIQVDCTQKPDGRWTGKVYFFSTFGDTKLQDWIDAGRPSSGGAMAFVGNALIQKWGAFKAGQLASYDEFQAVLTATLTDSWEWPSVKSKCKTVAPGGACYLFSNGQGFSVYTDSLLSYPIPTGIVEMPIAMNLKQGADAKQLTGRIESSLTLQYPGNPKAEMTFGLAPSSCMPGDLGACVVPVTRFDATVFQGGRYDSQGNPCTTGFKNAQIPWLVPGFLQGAQQDSSTGGYYKMECRDEYLPFGADPTHYDANTSFASANPIPDATPRPRAISLVDGILVNQNTMLVLVKEQFHGFTGQGKPIEAYGLMMLKKGSATLTDADFQPSTVTDQASQAPQATLTATCSPSTLDMIMPGLTLAGAASQGQLNDVVSYLIDGTPASGSVATPVIGINGNNETAHYLCVDTGLFDGGPDANAATACPPGAQVKYFTLSLSSADQAAADALLRGLSCQQGYDPADRTGKKKATCEAVYNTWRAAGTYGFRESPRWLCLDSSGATCKEDWSNRRKGKTFYQVAPPAQTGKIAFNQIDTDITDAFRYKTRFRNRLTGQSVGFAPTVCVANGGDSLPYCYDPTAIEAIRSRVDCLLVIYSNPAWFSALSDGANNTKNVKGELVRFLTKDFASQYTVNPLSGVPLSNDGFERLNAELLIMMGDEAYTRAFASRFDLAGSAAYGFEGSLFEPDGINLSGAAGYQMFSLYQAAQYYQMALDRFYSMSGAIEASVNRPDSFVTATTVTSYFDKLIRASTQKSLAWSEVAKQYETFNRPDLARLVVERAYSATYLESVLLSKTMLEMIQALKAEDRDQVVREVEQSSLGFKAAMLEMNDVFQSIQDGQTYFGYAPDYIPFPAMNPTDVNAFEKELAITRQKLATAATKEQIALADNKSYETDQASFQSELTSIQNTYENQLATLCGTFTVGGQAYPAIPKYASLTPDTAALGNPCGMVGNGTISDDKTSLQQSYLDIQKAATAIQNTLAEADIERRRVDEACNKINSFANYTWLMDGKVNDAQSFIRDRQNDLSDLQRKLKTAEQITLLAKCTVGMASDCPSGLAQTAIFTGVALTNQMASSSAEGAISSRQATIDQLRQSQATAQIRFQCDTAQVDSKAKVNTILLNLATEQLDAEKANYSMATAASKVQADLHQAQRLMTQQTQAEQMAINVQAAKNDPNVRIYKNDAIINADWAFQEAIKEAYKATRVFEYYTSQSYSKLSDLFLIRMVSAGDHNLERYVGELADAYAAFGEQFGNPDTRVMILSLRDDIMQIPRIGAGGVAISDADRIEQFRKKLADTSLLDRDGYIDIPFSTAVAALSPETRDHKIMGIEAEIIGSDVGDTLGRLYLRQEGTGVVTTLDGTKTYYSLPQREAVVNPFFNGQRVFAQDVYRNARFRDLPVVNTHWKLVINQKTEQVNKDINLQSLTDIKVYVYYTDFTSF